MTTSFRLGRLALSCSGLLVLAACGANNTATDQAATDAAAPATADSTQTKSAAMPTAAAFGKTTTGTEVQLFTLTNASGAKATISN